ncbi:MAG: phage terminase large subunit family protein [Planctomycetes bacterium]|nr:phage terminase large subunit family protein [Planctomycetota bacterium]
MKGRIYNAYADGLRPDPYVNLLDWNNEHRRLPKESSVEPGRYRSSRTPYVEEIFIELSPQSPTDTVVFVKPTQIGATEIANGFLFGTAKRYPGASMMVFPTDKMAQKHSKKKLMPSIRAMPILRDVIKPQKSKDSGNTQLLKEFPGGSWTLTGSNSPTAARSDTIRYLILDDCDGFVPDAGGEGAPIDLFKNRTDAVGSKKKIYINSTPTNTGASNIDDEYEESSQGKYEVPCPYCEAMQFLVWEQLKFTRDDTGEITDIWYECTECAKRIDEYQKTKMMKRGRYVHKYPDRKKRGFMINGLYSPFGWFSWLSMATEFLVANAKLKRGDSRAMKVWTNTRKAESYQESGEQPEWAGLVTRAEPYPVLTIPMGGCLLVSGVDTHDNRLDVKIKAFGPGEESWLIYHGVLWGDPNEADVWAQLDALLYKSYPHACGVDLNIITMAIDTGGHRTQAVYNYVRKRSPLVIAIKGSSSKGRAILGAPTKQDVDVSGRKIKNGVELWPVGTDVAKGVIYSRLKLTTPGHGFCHFPIGLEEEYYLQLTAEKLVKRYVKGFPVYEWVNTRVANHALDCEVYSLVAAYRAGVQTIDWDALSKRLGVRMPEDKISSLSEVVEKSREKAAAPAPTQVPDARQMPARPASRGSRGHGGYRRPAWLGR